MLGIDASHGRRRAVRRAVACSLASPGPGGLPLTGHRSVTDPAGPGKAAPLAGLRVARRVVSNTGRRGWALPHDRIGFPGRRISHVLPPLHRLGCRVRPIDKRKGSLMLLTMARLITATLLVASATAFATWTTIERHTASSESQTARQDLRDHSEAGRLATIPPA
jgi:hypothetical protein